ncbi:protein kinase [Pontiellaceae bacterium B12227]|nr:protein kinase [Pontiellaceae bacterium B12227]
MEPKKQPIAHVREIFSEAQRLPAGPERDAFVAKACGGNEELLKEVTSLLEVFQTTCGFLEHDASGAAFFDTPDLSETKINHYQLHECIGEGGFGEVYRAEQLEPLRREVALKVIKLGMDTKNVVARFRAEQQALARMNHPNIAQVYDAGATDSGRPYFVMELVRGVPILEYCDRHRFSLADRIALFQQVCEGIQHAHKKGILHRDLKPSNILVSEDEGKPVAKIIDFGVAKSLEGRLSEKMLATLEEILIGTPMYMSPEQLAGSTSELDARTDVYSLGIILYELVSGATPLAHKTASSLTLAEMREALHDRDLPRPSKRFQTLGKKTAVVARRRGIRPPALKRQLRGDLDWIVMKAIEMEPDHRYEDSITLAEDLARLQNNQSVLAGPPSLSRRFRKFVRRHKTTSLVIGSVLLTVLTGISIMTYSFIHLSREPLPYIEQRGWKLEKFHDANQIGVQGICIRPDGSILYTSGWLGTDWNGIYVAHKGKTRSDADTFAEGDNFAHPSGIIELSDGIYVAINYPSKNSKILKLSPDGGEPTVLCDSKIIDPYGVIIAPEKFDGPNVDPGDLLVFDNGWGYRDRSAIWAVSRSTGTIRPLITGNAPRRGFLNGSFGPDGMLYAGLNDGGHRNHEAIILRISPEGNAETVLDDFYFSEVINDQHEVTGIAVHPVTGEIFFACRNTIFAFLPGKTKPRIVLPKGRSLKWNEDGSVLYLTHHSEIWTLSGPGIESQPFSSERFQSSDPLNPAGSIQALNWEHGDSGTPNDTHFVDVNNTNQAPPYLSWETAANTIEQAVEAAAPGDTILINDGTYSVRKTLGINKAVSLQSRNGPEHTILDAGQRCRIFRIPASNGPCNIRGFTLTGGYSHGGAGIWISGSEPVTVEDCIITGNRSFGGGAGGIAIFTKGSESFDVTIRHCIITNNQSTTDGCGIRVYAPQSAAGTVNIVDCTVSGNSTESDGGGISCLAAGAQITISNCRVENNTAQGFGGGIQIYGKPADNSLVIIKSCTVLNNRAGRRGGGINATMEKKCQSTFLIEDCVVRGNTSVETGGGIRCFSYASSVRVTRCRVSHNTSGQAGGVMLGTKTVMTDSLIYGNKAVSGTGGGIRRGPPGGGTVINCTIVGNSSSESGGGTHIPKIINSIIYDNMAPQHPDIMPDTEVQFSCSMSLAYGVDGNLQADPMFTDPSAENFQLLENSLCIDAGTHCTSPCDLDRKPRTVDGNGDGNAGVDMGAFEFQPLEKQPSEQLPRGDSADIRIQFLGMTVVNPSEELVTKYGLSKSSLPGPVITELTGEAKAYWKHAPHEGCSFWIVENPAHGFMLNEEKSPRHHPYTVRQLVEAIVACSATPEEYQKIRDETNERCRKKAELLKDDPDKRDRLLRISKLEMPEEDRGMYICRVVYNYPNRRGTMTTFIRMAEQDFNRLRKLLQE